MSQNPWIKSGAPIAGTTYQYDRTSNRTQMQPLGFTATNDLQRHSYDGLQRLTRSVRGSTSTLKAQEAWGLDATGSALMLVAARLRHIAGTKWGTRKCRPSRHSRFSVAIFVEED